jgi:hypothetical protein
MIAVVVVCRSWYFLGEKCVFFGLDTGLFVLLVSLPFLYCNLCRNAGSKNAFVELEDGVVMLMMMM